MLFQHVIPDLVGRATAGRGIPRRRSRAELHLHRGDPAGDGDHLRHSARQPRPAADVQGDLRAVKDRADFVSMLFAKPRPPGLGPESTADELFAAFARVATSEALYKQHSAAINAHLTKTHALPLPAGDLGGNRGDLSDVLRQRFRTCARRRRYADLMAATDARGARAAISRPKKAFAFLKDWSRATSSCRSSAISVGRRPFARSGPTSRRAARPFARSISRTSSSTWCRTANGRRSAGSRHTAARRTSTFIRSQAAEVAAEAAVLSTRRRDGGRGQGLSLGPSPEPEHTAKTLPPPCQSGTAGTRVDRAAAAC